MNTEEWNGVPEGLFEKYGVYGSLYTRKLEAAIMRTKDFMMRLLGSGIEPASVSLEGFKYVRDHVLVHDVKLPHEAMRWDLAGVLIEEATKRCKSQDSVGQICINQRAVSAVKNERFLAQGTFRQSSSCLHS